MNYRFAWIFAALITLAAQAQEALFLTPERFLTASRETRVRLSEAKSASPATQDWAKFSANWVFVKTGLVQENRDGFEEWLQNDGTLKLPIPAPGPVVIGIDFSPQIETVASASLARLVTAPLKSGVGSTVKIRHHRSALTIFQTDWPGEQSPDSGVATAKTSLSSSIHPLMDPTRFRIGSDLALELVVRGEEAQDAQVHAANLTTGKTWAVKAQGGLCKFTPDAPGTYEFKFQLARPLVNDPEADFDLFSATLTFSIPSQKETNR